MNSTVNPPITRFPYNAELKLLQSSYNLLICLIKLSKDSSLTSNKPTHCQLDYGDFMSCHLDIYSIEKPINFTRCGL